MKQRILTGLVLAAAYILVLLCSGNAIFLNTVSLVLSISGVYELCRAAGYGKNKLFLCAMMVASAALSVLADMRCAGVVMVAALLGGICLMKQVQMRKEFPQWVVFLIGCLIACSFGMLDDLQMQESGLFLLTMTVLIPVITDTGAYFFSSAFGKHKLAPMVSPKKSWEGSVFGTFSAAAMGTLLGIKPLIHVDENGKLVAVGKPRGKKKALEALVSAMEKGWMPEISNRVIIGHGDSPDVAKELRDMVSVRFPEAQVFIAPIGPVIGAHAGPGVMTVFFWGNNH